ncbi:MAG: phenylacetate--CoA ligase family protein [Desulfarculus sp.]|nr:phenylacetate--CoA ligase family protein [Desulfarculus sp.]
MNLYAGLWGGLMQPAYERLRGRLTPGLQLRLEQSQYWPLEVLARQQWQDLEALLNLARERVPFYADWFANSGITVEDMTRARDLSPLPVIGREELMAEPGRFQASPRLAGTFGKATGGSTGRPLRFLVDPASDQWRLAMSRRGYAWAGCRPGVRQVYLWAGDLTPPPGLARLKRGLHRGLMGQIYLDCFDMTPAQMERALKVISRFRPACLVAFTSAALILARHARARGWRPPASLRSLIVGAEALHAPGRQALEAAFGCPVFETYGSREFMLMAAECPRHQGLPRIAVPSTHAPPSRGAGWKRWRFPIPPTESGPAGPPGPPYSAPGAARAPGSTPAPADCADRGRRPAGGGDRHPGGGAHPAHALGQASGDHRPGPGGPAVRRHLELWLGAYLRQALRPRPLPTGRPLTICLAVADHFEPFWDRADLNTACARLAAWEKGLPKLCQGIADSRGRPPQHTFFYPLEEYHPQVLERS